MKAKTFKQNLDQLEELLAWFESDDISLEEVSVKFVEANKILGKLEKQLSEAENEITILKNQK